MRIVNEPAVEKFSKKHADSRNSLEKWLLTVRNAAWQTIQDVKQDCPSIDGGVIVASGARVTVFDIGGNKYRPIADVNFTIQTVIVRELMTHSEYSKNLWKQR